ncbi:hypothetical protein POSPLADRAFT_1092100, partial [Postia placenta MAD-698-R-SB12]
MRLMNNMVETLVDTLYPGIVNGQKPDQYFLERTILSAKNDAVDSINGNILEKFPGEKVVLTGADTVKG